jgi:hypothetical protein
VSKDGVTSRVLEFVKNKDEITAAEIAAFVVELTRQDLGLDPATYDSATLGKSVVWRGATSYAKDIIKRPRVVEELLSEDDEDDAPDEAQGELFTGLSAFVRVDKADGAWRFKRRRALYRDEYVAAMGLLRAKSRQLADKIERHQTDYDTALPHWKQGMTFGEAVEAAAAR